MVSSTWGRVVLTIINSNGSIVNNNGTSFSAPIMAGGVACLLQALPEASNSEIMQFVRMSASQYDTPDNLLGFGIPNLAEAHDIGLSVLEQEVFEFKIYPNPTRDVVHINIPSSNSTITELRLVDVTGKIIMQNKIPNGHSKLDMSKMASGVYILSLQSENTSTTLKLIKQ